MPVETREDRAERLFPTALDLAARIRTDDPDQLYGELLAGMSHFDVCCLAMILAGGVEDAQSPRVIWGWALYQLRTLVPWQGADDPAPSVDALTSGQLDALIADLAARGLRDDQIGDRLGLSREAVAKRRGRSGTPAGCPAGHVGTARERARAKQGEQVAA